MKRSATVWMSRIRNCIFKDGRADWKTCVLVGLDSLGSDVSGIYIFQNWGRKEFPTGDTNQNFCLQEIRACSGPAKMMRF